MVGGGDVYLVAEALKHPGVERVYLLELDEEVVQVARKHYDVARDALNDPRVEVWPGDAFDSIAELAGKLDVIMVDLTDPIGPAARLFEDEFYARVRRARAAPRRFSRRPDRVDPFPSRRRARLFLRVVGPFRPDRSVVGCDRDLPRRVLDVRHRNEGPGPTRRASPP